MKLNECSKLGKCILSLFLAVVLFLGTVMPVWAVNSSGDPKHCREVRFADPGWSDVTGKTAIASRILSGLGYRPVSIMVSLHVSYLSLKNGDVDVFLGGWLPAQKSIFEPLVKAGSIEKLGINLPDAMYSLGVMDYTYEKGLRHFKDIATFRKELNNKIYGLAPGGDGNEILGAMIRENRFNLRGFKLIASSEQAMLAAVDKLAKKREDIVFLAWAPHPMNRKHPIKYLSGGELPTGAFGIAEVYTVSRAGYSAECKNVAKFLSALKFTLPMEEELMGLIMDGMHPMKAAADWVRKNQDVWHVWLNDVTDFYGGSGLLAVENDLRS